MRMLERVALIVLLSIGWAACSRNSGGGDPPSDTGVAPEVSVAGIVAEGGESPGDGGKGGTVVIAADPSVVIGSAAPAPEAPLLPVPPDAGAAIGSGDLGSDVTRPGTILIAGQVSSTGVDTFRSIMSVNGDIVVSGTLAGAVQGAATQGLGLAAPNGTVYITGLVNAAVSDNGGPVEIEARRVVITGTIDARGRDGVSGKGGSVAIAASGAELYFTTGSILTTGGGGAPKGGDGGNVSIEAFGASYLDGVINAEGGGASGSADDVTGGRGGNVSVMGAAALDVVSTIRTRGGSAATTGLGATGGDGGEIGIDGPAAVRFYGAMDARGGKASASAAGTGLAGGAAGSVQIGTGVPLASLEMPDAAYSVRGGSGGAAAGAGGIFSVSGGAITLRSAIDARGGNGLQPGPASAGAGGVIELLAYTGGLDQRILLEPAALLACGGGLPSGGGAGAAGGVILVNSTGPSVELSGTLAASGSDSASLPGAGGTVRIVCETGGGSIVSAAAIDVSGGSSSAASGVTVHGAAAGEVRIAAFSPAGSVTLAAGSAILMDGGASTGTGTGGGGGLLEMDVPENFVSIGGSTLARGGPARGTGGRGGRGGAVDVNADSDGINPATLPPPPPGSPPPPPQIGGSVTIETGALLDFSGGSGTFGGSARTSFTSDVSDNIEQTCVYLNADTWSDLGGLIVNNGVIIARGAANNGWGGDVMFHGRGVDTKDPLAGFQDRRGHGTGEDGEFLGD